MNKVITCVIAAGLSLGLSQVTIAKEHHGPKSNQAQSQRHSVDRGAQNHNRNRYNNDRRSNQRHVIKDNQRRYDDRNRHGSRHDYRDDRRDYGHRHSDSRGHDYHHRDRYRNHYRPHNYGHYRSYNHWKRYNSHPVSVYYLGQDWYYYGGYYHPYARGHMHTRHCHHRYWEPLAAGIVLGAILGW